MICTKFQTSLSFSHGEDFAFSGCTKYIAKLANSWNCFRVEGITIWVPAITVISLDNFSSSLVRGSATWVTLWFYMKLGTIGKETSRRVSVELKVHKTCHFLWLLFSMGEQKHNYGTSPTLLFPTFEGLILPSKEILEILLHMLHIYGTARTPVHLHLKKM